MEAGDVLQPAPADGAPEPNAGKCQYFPELVQLEIWKKLDVKRLLLLRTVCKPWQNTIDEVLKRRVSNFLQAFFSQSNRARRCPRKLTDFVNQYDNRIMPFESLSIQAQGENQSVLRGRRIRQFLTDKVNKIEKLSLDIYREPSHLLNLFLDIKCLTDNPSLTHLDLSTAGRNLALINMDDRSVNLPSLTHFQVKNKIDEESLTGYTAKVINQARNLTHLSLAWFCVNNEFLPSLKLENIQFLQLSGSSFALSDTDFRSILEKVSNTLKELHTEDYFAKLGTFEPPVLPKLHTVRISRCRWRGVDPNFTLCQLWINPTCMPNLKKVGFNQVNKICENPDELIIHPGVEALCIEPNCFYMREILESSRTWFETFLLKFPSIISLDFTWTSVIASWVNYNFMDAHTSDQTFENLVSVFPNLDTLILRNSRFKPVYFTGRLSTNSEIVPGSSASTNRSTVIRPSIRDLPRLKTLVLDDRGSLTSEMLRSIGELSQLEKLEFQWNRMLIRENIASSLNHLREICIGNCCKPQFNSEVNPLFLQMPSIRCGCKTYKDASGFFREDYSYHRWSYL